MPADQELSPSVIVAADKSSASLRVPAHYDRSLLTEYLLTGIITGMGVEITDQAAAAIKSIVQDPPPIDDDATYDIATAAPPTHGVDGFITWVVDEKSTPGEAAPESDPPGSGVSHYERCSFDMVETGEVIGRVHAPESAHDGRDVLGNTLPAKVGKEAKLFIDESIMQKADGTLVAQQDGVLFREPGKARIRKHIQINNYVDFSTGNLDFDGDITIEKGVRDCFIVKATGNVEVKGLIEAATIRAGKDLVALGGFAGREQGHVETGGNLIGKYLDNIQGHISQDLCIDREIINCDLMIDGQINSPTGSIIGGNLVPTGEVHVGTIGSGAGVKTELVIGSVPMLQPFATELTAIVEKLTANAEVLNSEKDTIDKNSTKGRMTATDKERQCELIFELSTINANLDKAQRTLGLVQQKINQRRRVDVKVDKAIHHGATIILDGCRYHMSDKVAGPVHLYMEGKSFVYRIDDGPALPVEQVSEVKADLPGRAAA